MRTAKARPLPVCSSGFTLKARYLGFPCREARTCSRDRQKGPGQTDGDGCRPARTARTTSAGSRSWGSQTAAARALVPMPLNPLPWPGREPHAVSGYPRMQNSSRWRRHSRGTRCASGECRFIYRKPAPHLGAILGRRPVPQPFPANRGGTHGGDARARGWHRVRLTRR